MNNANCLISTMSTVQTYEALLVNPKNKSDLLLSNVFGDKKRQDLNNIFIVNSGCNEKSVNCTLMLQAKDSTSGTCSPAGLTAYSNKSSKLCVKNADKCIPSVNPSGDFECSAQASIKEGYLVFMLSKGM